MASIPQQLTDSILEEYKCISVLIKYAAGEYDPDEFIEPTEYACVKKYLSSCEVDILYSTMGLHLLGQNSLI